MTSKVSVTITMRHIVLSANDKAWKTLDSPFRLGPLDSLLPPFIPISVLFIYEQLTASPDMQLIQAERLQCAMALLLDYYPHLTGRLHINPGDGTPEVNCLGTGAELLEAQCSERLDAFLPPSVLSPDRISNLPDAGNALLPPFDPAIEYISRNPIFTVQHTRFVCGGVVLGVRLNHMICDGDGFFQLVRDLAELYHVIGQEFPLLAHPPHIRSYMSDINITPEARQAALDFQSSLYFVEPPSADTSPPPTLGNSYPPSPAPNWGRFIRFSSLELKALKAHATEPNGNSWISTFDALSAHLYHRIHRARLQLRVQDPSLGELSRPDFHTPVNLRSRLGHGGFPPRYFPNAAFTVCTALPLDILANGPLWKVAKALHDLTRITSTTSTDEINRTIKWMAVQPDKRKIKQDFQYGTGSLMVSQWNRFDMYASAVFDVPPVLVGPPFTPISLVDGLAFFCSTEAQDTRGDMGAIDVALSLSEPLWEILDQDEEFRRFV